MDDPGISSARQANWARGAAGRGDHRSHALSLLSASPHAAGSCPFLDCLPSPRRILAPQRRKVPRWLGLLHPLCPLSPSSSGQRGCHPDPGPGSWARSRCLRRPGAFRSGGTDLSSAGFLPNPSLVLLLSIPGKPIPEGCVTVRLLLKVSFLVPESIRCPPHI